MWCVCGLVIGAVAVLSVAPARGQTCPEPCQLIDFENYPVGTSITTQYQAQGVLFSLIGSQCSDYLPVIQHFPDPPGDHTVGPSQLGQPTGQVLALPFSPVTPSCCLQITFVHPQRYVKLWVHENCLGAPCTINVTANAGGMKSVMPACQPAPWLSVCFISQECDIQTVTICAECPVSMLAIDDLGWGTEGIPGEVYISDSPHMPPISYNVACNRTLNVHGWSYDLDACDYGDELWIRRYPDPSTLQTGCPLPNTWCHLGSATGNRGTPPAPPASGGVPGLLYSIVPSMLPVAQFPEGIYQIEIDGRDECGATVKHDETTFCLDESPPNVAITCPQKRLPPQPPMIVHGNLPICGSACDFCKLDSWAAWGMYQPPGTPFSFDFAIGSGSGCAAGKIAYWNTLGFPAGGLYTLFLSGTDACGQTTSDSVDVIVDNDPPIAELSEPTGEACDFLCVPPGGIQLQGVAFDVNMGHWELRASIGGGPWQPIGGGTTNVGSPGNPGFLTTWDPCPDAAPCCYMLWLRVWDKAESCCIGDPGADVGNYSEDFLCGNLGKRGDYNHDGFCDFTDIDFFVADIAPGVHCPCPCPDCPVGSVAENEPCNTDTNGGCNSSLPIFGTITCGETICGTSFCTGSTRDTDWYRIATSSPTRFRITGDADFDLQIVLIGDALGNCHMGPFYYAWATRCSVATLTTPLLPAGTYYVWVGPQWSGAFTCGPQQYWVKLDCYAFFDDAEDWSKPGEADMSPTREWTQPPDISNKR